LHSGQLIPGTIILTIEPSTTETPAGYVFEPSLGQASATEMAEINASLRRDQAELTAQVRALYEAASLSEDHATRFHHGLFRARRHRLRTRDFFEYFAERIRELMATRDDSLPETSGDVVAFGPLKPGFKGRGRVARTGRLKPLTVKEDFTE
jgi:hypothetical protein